MSDVFVARQPIFDRNGRLAGYELLHRLTYAAVTAGDGDSGEMTGNVMVNGLLGIGLSQLTGGTRAWVNFASEPLLRRDFDLLDPRSYVIELLETVPCDEETIAACRELRAKGYTLALDDFVADVEEYKPILELAQIVKISVLEQSKAELHASVQQLAKYPVQLLAEKVEDKAMYDLCQSLGFSLFQGHYFSRPEVVRRKDLPGEMAAIARLMNLTLDVNAHDDDLERVFRSDPGLSVKLLKIVNSAAHGGKGIESIHHAVRLIGRMPLYRWLALLFVSSVPRGGDVDRELILSAIECGRFTELLGARCGKRGAGGGLFLTGLLSSFDSILGIPMPELLQQVHVAPDVDAALLDRTGPYAPFLELASDYAAGNWEKAIAMGSDMGLVDDLSVCYVESSAWARDVLKHH